MPTATHILKYCETNLGESGVCDLDWYDNRRPREITPKVFFDEYAWATLVTGTSRKSAQSWSNTNDFRRVFSLASCRSNSLNKLLTRVRTNQGSYRGKKLAAVHTMARDLKGMSSRAVADKYFGGVVQTRFLQDDHIRNLAALGIPFIGPANAQFIVRNLGGEAIKCDRWILALMKYFKWDFGDLRRAAKRLGWGLGRVDVVLWSYCEEHIRATGNIPRHFRSIRF